MPPGLTVEILDKMERLPGDLGPLPVSSSAEISASHVELGVFLFFDLRLSADGKVSCATCHNPELAYGDGLPLGIGNLGAVMARHTPTLLNVKHNKFLFWDGRASSFEEQAILPLLNGKEMGIADELTLEEKLKSLPEYASLFHNAFGRSPNTKDALAAIAAFERTLTTPDSRFDKYAAGNKDALTTAEKRGLALFAGKAACSQCHSGFNLTDENFHNLGIASADSGRGGITNVASDNGAFKTPTLRNVALTAPYMHDGSFSTLEDVVDLYDRGGGTGANKSSLIFELGLTQAEKYDLMAFLGTLTGEVPTVGVPAAFKNEAAYAKVRQPPAPEFDYVPDPPSDVSTLVDLMAKGLHEQFTFIGHTLWHSRPFTPKRRTHVQASASSLAASAEKVAEMVPSKLDAKDRAYFDESARRLVDLSHSLSKASEYGTLSEIRRVFVSVEHRCLVCHERFRPDLIWTENPTELGDTGSQASQ